jgi:hypothetical protein
MFRVFADGTEKEMAKLGVAAKIILVKEEHEKEYSKGIKAHEFNFTVSTAKGWLFGFWVDQCDPRGNVPCVQNNEKLVVKDACFDDFYEVTDQHFIQIFGQVLEQVDKFRPSYSYVVSEEDIVSIDRTAANGKTSIIGDKRNYWRDSIWYPTVKFAETVASISTHPVQYYVMDLYGNNKFMPRYYFPVYFKRHVLDNLTNWLFGNVVIRIFNWFVLRPQIRKFINREMELTGTRFDYSVRIMTEEQKNIMEGWKYGSIHARERYCLEYALIGKTRNEAIRLRDDWEQSEELVSVESTFDNMVPHAADVRIDYSIGVKLPWWQQKIKK